MKDTATKSGFLQLGHNRIAYQSIGTGPAIVWIHGGGADQHMWAPQVSYFKQNYQCITYDIRGHGASTFTDNELPDIRDLELILDSLHIDQFFLAGLSLGAILALDFTFAHPMMVKKLMLLSPGLSGIQEKEESYLKPLLQLGPALQANDLDQVVQILESMTFGKASRKDTTGLNQARSYLSKVLRRHFSGSAYARGLQLFIQNPVEHLNKIRCPALILHGNLDQPYMRKNVQVLKDSISKLKVLELEGAAHLLNMEMPQEVNRAIETFLKEK